MLQRAGGDHNHDASNHGYDRSTATYYWRADDNDNDARGHRRLLIAGRGCLCRRHGLFIVAGGSKRELIRLPTEQ